MATTLPVNIDATYADDGTDASVAAHQQHHDTVHAEVNRISAGIVVSRTQTVAYTLAKADEGTLVEVNSASALSLTVPTNASVPFALGTTIAIRQYGAGQVTVAPATGVTIRSRDAATKLAGQYSEGVLTYRGSDEWILSGDLVV